MNTSWSTWHDKAIYAALRFTVIMAVGLSVGLGSYYLLKHLDETIHQQQLASQEVVHHG